MQWQAFLRKIRWKETVSFFGSNGKYQNEFGSVLE